MQKQSHKLELCILVLSFSVKPHNSNCFAPVFQLSSCYKSHCKWNFIRLAGPLTMAPTRDALKINQTSIVLRSVQGFYAHVLVEPSYCGQFKQKKHNHFVFRTAGWTLLLTSLHRLSSCSLSMTAWALT